MHLLKAMGVFVAAALFCVSAWAADYTVDYLTPKNAPIKWDGMYGGLGVEGGYFTSGTRSSMDGFVHGVVGANSVVDDVLYGVEVTAGGYVTENGNYGPGFGTELRMGYVVVPEAVMYGAVGGYAFGPGALYGYVGAGIEYAMTENLSFDVEYKYYGLSNTSWSAHVLGTQALWHF